MARRLGLAGGLAFQTSCLGFVAVSTNPIGLVREFGLVAAAGRLCSAGVGIATRGNEGPWQCIDTGQYWMTGEARALPDRSQEHSPA